MEEEQGTDVSHLAVANTGLPQLGQLTSATASWHLPSKANISYS